MSILCFNSSMETENGFFTTLDAYISGYLTLKGFTPKLIEQVNKVVFSFQLSPDLNEAIAEYNKGAMIEASRMAFAIKTLKGQIFSLKKDKGKRYDEKKLGSN